MRQMKLTARMLEIVKLFDAEGIRYVTLKGPALSQYLYGDPCARHCNDLDILVSKEDFYRAENLLRKQGAVEKDSQVSPLLGDPGSIWNYAHHGEYGLKGMNVEIHWKRSSLDSLLGLPDSSSFLAERRMLIISGVRVAAFVDNPLINYLTIHGTAHCWNRLKWLYDIAFLQRQVGLVQEVEKSAVRRANSWSNVLLQAFFGEKGMGSIKRSLRMRLLFSLACRQMLESQYSPEHVRHSRRRILSIVLILNNILKLAEYFFPRVYWRARAFVTGRD